MRASAAQNPACFYCLLQKIKFRLVNLLSCFKRAKNLRFTVVGLRFKMVSKPEDWSGKMDEKDKGPILITLLAPSLEWDMVKKVARGPPPLPNKAYFIFPEVLAAYLAGNDRTELAVLDLRAKGT